MKKYKIVALFGEAGAGKDFIQHNIMKTIWGQVNLNPIVSYTTRPPRENEIDGVHYHFISTPAEFIKQDLIEYTIFRNWWYGTPIDSLDLDKINIGIFNIKGIDQLINNDIENRIECLPIYIKVTPKTRLLRQLQREADPDCNEIIRRFLTDQADFLNIPFHYMIVKNEYNEIQPIVNEINDLIREWSKEIK